MRPMKTTPRSDADAQKVSRRTLLRSGVYDALIREAVETESKRGNEMIDVSVVVYDGDGGEREFRDFLTNTTLGALKLRHACEAVGALSKYESGDISAADFAGSNVRVKIGTEKRRGSWPDRNVIEDYAATALGVVQLRSAG
jgi:hypothetical protein